MAGVNSGMGRGLAVMRIKVSNRVIQGRVMMSIDGLSLESDNEGSHVIAAQSGHGILCQQFVQQQLQYLFVSLAFADVVSHDIYEALTILYVFLPDPVATHYDELISLLALVLADVWLAGDHLLVVAQSRVLLVVEVAKGTRQVQSAVHAPHVHHSSCLLDALLFLLAFRLVIEGKIHRLAAAAEHAPRVSSIGHDVLGGCDEDYVGCTSGVLGNGIADINAALLVEELRAFLALNDLIHELERLIKRIDVLSLGVRLAGGQQLGESFSDVFADLMALIVRVLPPCPSKTAKRELVLSRLGQQMAASSMVFLQPE